MSTPSPHWLDAFARSWPIVSPQAFETAHSTVSCGSPLRAEAMDQLRRMGRGISRDVLDLVIDGAWGTPGQARPISLARHLNRFACDLLDANGTAFAMSSGGAEQPSYADRVDRWRYASLALPADLIVAARLGPTDVHRVDLVTPGVANVLSRPIAETHLHLSGAFSFGVLWNVLMDGETDWASVPDSNVSDVPFGGIAQMRRRIAQAGVARIVLAAFLEGSHGRESFDSFILGAAEGYAREAGGDQDSQRRRRSLVQTLAQLVRASGSEDDLSIPTTTILAELVALRERSAGRRDHGFEVVWTRRAFDYLLRASPQLDSTFELLFWQYERVRCRLFQWVTQQPSTAGLSWFVEHYNRIDAVGARVHTEREAWTHAARGLNLQSFEVRRVPHEDLEGKVEALVARMPLPTGECGVSAAELGFVLHLVKSGASDDPSKNVTAWRWGDWYRHQGALVERLAWQLDLDPTLLVFVRGVDIANRELAVPGWLVGRLLYAAREGSMRPSAYLSRLRPDVSVPPFRITAHAGEDFRSLHEGIRRIDELLPCLREGDRIGHGLALALPPREWARRARGTKQPREERLWDLVWECSLYERGELQGSGTRIAWVHGEAGRLFRELHLPFDENADDAVRAKKLWRQLFDGSAFDRLGYPAPTMSAAAPEGPYQDLYEYLSSGSVFERAREGVVVPYDETEVEVLLALQRNVRGKLARREITVEVNPSSNLIVGDLARIEDHPAFELAGLHEDPEGRPRVAVTLNDDDPLTFATCLADEYAYMYAAMMRGNVASAKALAWLEEARQAAWRSRFTLPASAQGEFRRGFIGATRPEPNTKIGRGP